MKLPPPPLRGWFLLVMKLQMHVPEASEELTATGESLLSLGSQPINAPFCEPTRRSALICVETRCYALKDLDTLAYASLCVTMRRSASLLSASVALLSAVQLMFGVSFDQVPTYLPCYAPVHA
jgi:hypothetical protein